MGTMRWGAVLGISILLTGLGTGPAGAADGPGIASVCAMDVGSISAEGNYVDTVVTAATPPTSVRRVGPAISEPGEAKASTTWEVSNESSGGTADSGYAIYGTTLYSTLIARPPDGVWWGRGVAMYDMQDYTAFARSAYPKGANPQREYFYGLRNDGVLVRWKRDAEGWFRPLGSYAGFSAVKAITQISSTATYDSFLATTRGGALYTIRIPITSPMTTVVKVVRTSTWQGFEAIVAEKCGTQSTLLTGIDRDTGAAYLYAVGHANGTATVIQSLGKIPGTFNDPIHFLRTPRDGTPLNGE